MPMSMSRASEVLIALCRKLPGDFLLVTLGNLAVCPSWEGRVRDFDLPLKRGKNVNGTPSITAHPERFKLY